MSSLNNYFNHERGYSTAPASQRDPRSQAVREPLSSNRPPSKDWTSSSGPAILPNHKNMDRLTHLQRKRFTHRMEQVGEMSLAYADDVRQGQEVSDMWPSNCYPAPTHKSCWGWDNGSNYHSNGLYGQWASRQPYSYNGQYRYQQQFTQPPPYPPPTPALGYSTKEYNQETIQAPSGYSTFNDNEHGTGEHTTTSQKSTSEKPFRYAVSEHDKTPVLPAFPEIKRPYKRKKNKKGKKEKNKVSSIRSATVTAGVEKDDKHSTESNVILTMNDEEMARICSITNKFFNGADCQHCGKKFVKGEFDLYSQHVTGHTLKRRAEDVSETPYMAGPSDKPANWAEFNRRRRLE